MKRLRRKYSLRMIANVYWKPKDLENYEIVLETTTLSHGHKSALNDVTRKLSNTDVFSVAMVLSWKTGKTKYFKYSRVNSNFNWVEIKIVTASSTQETADNRLIFSLIKKESTK